eukprot:SAG22_NODE_2050_length_3084_cov_2.021106_2_plen_629_part_01
MGLKAIVVRDSRDGRSWSAPRTVLNDTLPSKWPGDDGISMGTAVYDGVRRTVLLFYAACSHVPGRAAPAPAHCPHSKLLVRSPDQGQHWSAPQDLTGMLAAMPGIWGPGPATGIQILAGSPPVRAAGRLLVCGSYRPMPKYSAKRPVRSISQCIISDDHGETFSVAGSANYSGRQGTSTDHQPNEVQPALLSNGSVLLSARDVGKGDGHRLLALSTDSGQSFGAARPEKQLYDYPSTEGSMLRHGRCLYVSNLGEDTASRRTNDPCEAPPAPSPCSFRHNLTLHESCDDAETWKLLRSVWAGPAAYSSLASLPWRSDAVGVLFESGPMQATDSLAPYRQLSFAEVPLRLASAPGPGIKSDDHAAGSSSKHPQGRGGGASGPTMCQAASMQPVCGDARLSSVGNCLVCVLQSPVLAGCDEASMDAFCQSGEDAGAVWHAAPSSDGGAGSIVAALRAAGEVAKLQNRATTVQLASGRYQLREPLVLPGGVSLLGAQSGGGTVLSGGVAITGWAPDGLGARPWLWRASLPPPLRGAFREFSNGPRKEGWANGTTDDAIRQLWVNGQRRGVARTKLLRYLAATGTGIVAFPGQLRRTYNSSSVRAVTYQHWTAAPRTVAGTSNVVCPADEMPG